MLNPIPAIVDPRRIIEGVTGGGYDSFFFLGRAVSMTITSRPP
jgi:hypothetical protein